MVKAYTEFQPLKKILIGKSLPTSIVEDTKLKNILTPSTKRLLTDLLDETEEDYQRLVKICEDFGTKVYRPDYSIKQLDPYLMNPRDELIILDDTIICANEAKTTCIDLLRPISDKNSKIKKNSNTHGLMPPSIIRLGNDIIMDIQEGMVSNKRESINYIKNWLEPLGYNIIDTVTHDFKFKAKVSHADSVFSIQKPGVLLTCQESRHYTENIFKKWDVCQVENSLEAVHEWMKFKYDTKSFGFVEEKYIDPVWNKLISNWLSDWVGYSEETVFDVNCLSLDESHVVVTNYNKKAFDYFKKHKIEPIICPFRHRWFWDGGIHCITLDIEREGERESYL